MATLNSNFGSSPAVRPRRVVSGTLFDQNVTRFYFQKPYLASKKFRKIAVPANQLLSHERAYSQPTVGITLKSLQYSTPQRFPLAIAPEKKIASCICERRAGVSFAVNTIIGRDI